MRELNRLGIASVIDAGGGFQNYPNDYRGIKTNTLLSDTARGQPNLRPPRQADDGHRVKFSAGTDATRVASYNSWVALSWLVTSKALGCMGLYSSQPVQIHRTLSD